MLHLKNQDNVPKDVLNLLTKARSLNENLDVTIRDTRVSTKYLEFDVSIDKESLDGLVSNLKPIGVLDHAKHVVEESIEKEAAIKEGIFYFNEERFWECHEVLEGVWNNCFEGEKDLVQGIILVAAALVHFQKDENQICISILGRALEKLSRSSGKYHNIDVEQLKSNINKIIDTKDIFLFKI